MNIVYQHLDKTITPQQASLLESYCKVFTSPSGLAKIKETFVANVISNVDYYRDEDESEQQAINNLLTYACAFNVFTREQYGTFIVENANVYNINKELIAKFKNLIDGNGDTMCYQEISLETGLPQLEETSKYIGKYVESEYEGNPFSAFYCEFYYKEDGSLDYCEFNYMSEYDSERYDQRNIELIRNKFVLSDEMYSYYLTATFLPAII